MQDVSPVLILTCFLVAGVVVFLPAHFFRTGRRNEFLRMYSEWKQDGWYVSEDGSSRCDVDYLIDRWLALNDQGIGCTREEMRLAVESVQV